MTTPRRVELNLGWACNNDCVFCAEQERREHSRVIGRFRIPAEEIVADLRRFRAEGFDHVTFLGGEPTIRKDLPQLIHTARQLGYARVLITSNGRMLGDRSRLRTLLRAGLTDVCISLHGPDAATHDGLTGNPGSFAAAERALFELVLAHQPFFTSTVITRPNEATLESLVQFLHAFRPTRIYMALPNATGGALRRFASLYPVLPEVAPHVHRALDAAAALGQPVSISKLPYCHLVGRERYSDDLLWAPGVRRRIEPQVSERVEQRFGDRTVMPLACGGCRYRLSRGIHLFVPLHRLGGRLHTHGL